MSRAAPQLEGSPSADLESPLDSASEAARPMGGYRVSGGLEARSIELEQDLILLRERYEALEREMWGIRKRARRVKATRAISTGGVGATIGAALSLGLLAADLGVSPFAMLCLVVLGYVLGVIAGMRWAPVDDKFPRAPPRLR